MKPGAHIAAAIDLMMLVNDGWDKGSRQPADGLFAGYFKERRYIGSKDRGQISALVYLILRYGGSLEWWLEHAGLEATPRTLVLSAMVVGQHKELSEIDAALTGEAHSAATLDPVERAGLHKLEGQRLTHDEMPDWVRYNYPQWMEPKLIAALGDELAPVMAALLKEAPVDLRVNPLKATRQQLLGYLQEAGFEPQALESPYGIRLRKRGALFTLKAFQSGWFEMQDEGSQRVAGMVDAKPGQKVIDFCAGAGGKTLGIAAAMENRGRILAWDTSEKRLSQMPKRLARAGVHNVTPRVISSESDAFVKRHKRSADWVLIDAPCTGSGTWRRSPDLKWRTGPKDLAELTAIQERILNSAARLVKDGGALVYATCSLFGEENAAQKERFLGRHGDFFEEREEILWPHRSQTDGFYAVRLRRKGETVSEDGKMPDLVPDIS